MINIALTVGFLAVLIASIFDIKTREVPDLLNYGLLFFAIIFRVSLSLNQVSFMPLLEGIAGFAVFLILALLMYYLGQWGGGDSKLLMGLGALIGIPLEIQIPFLALFLINTILVGMIYGIIWSVVLAIKNFKSFKKQLIKVRKQKIVKYIKIVLLVLVLFSIILFFFSNDILLTFMIAGFTTVSILTFYLFIFLKGVQDSCMIKKVSPSKLTIGDWLVEDIKYKGKKISTKTGLDEKQIKLLKKRGKNVKIKYGIPFVPAFLLGFVLTIIGFNIFVLLNLF